MTAFAAGSIGRRLRRVLLIAALCACASAGCNTIATLKKSGDVVIRTEKGRLLEVEKTRSKALPVEEVVEVEAVDGHAVRVFEARVRSSEHMIRRTYEKKETYQDHVGLYGAALGRDLTCLLAVGIPYVVSGVYYLRTGKDFADDWAQTSYRGVRERTKGRVVETVKVVENVARDIDAVTTGYVGCTVHNGSRQARFAVPIESDGTATAQAAQLAPFLGSADVVTIDWEYRGRKLTTSVSEAEQARLLATLTPPHLVLDRAVKLSDGLSSGEIKGGRQGSIAFDLQNDGAGAAFSVWLEIRGPRPGGLAVPDRVDVGDLQGGQVRSVTVPVGSDVTLRDGSVDLEVQAREAHGRHSRPVRVKLRTVRMEKPSLCIARWECADAGGLARGNGNQVAENGEQVELRVLVQNRGEGEARDAALSIVGLDPRVGKVVPTADLGTLPPGGQKWAALCLGFDKRYRPGGEGADRVDVWLRAEDGRKYGNAGSRKLGIDYRYREPLLAIGPIRYLDGQEGTASRGNGNGLVEQDEQVELVVEIENRGSADAEAVEITATTGKPGATVRPQTQSLGTIRSGLRSETRFWVNVPMSVPPGELVIALHVTEGGFGKSTVFRDVKKVYAARVVEASIPDPGGLAGPDAAPGRPAAALLDDVDEVPILKVKTPENRFGVVVGVREYKLRQIPGVRFAVSDARRFREYLLNMGGFAGEDVMMLEDGDATLTGMRAYIKQWLPRNVGRNDLVVVYFAGHGVPGGARNQPYLLPYNGDPGFIETTGYSIEEMKEDLARLPTRKVAMIVDACYVSPQGTRPGILEVVDPTRVGSMSGVLMTSVEQGQFSNEWKEKGHGLFTYFVLKGMRGAADSNGDGWVDLEEVYGYVAPSVRNVARKELGREQSPCKQGGGATIRLTRSLGRR